MWVWIWLGVIVASIAIEAITMELVTVWFILGSLVALIMASFKVSVLAQVITAIAISTICLLCFRRLALKWLKKDKDKTNMERTFGEKVKLLTPITKTELGTVKVNDVIYNAKSESGEEIKAGQFVELLKLEGNKYIVKKVEK